MAPPPTEDDRYRRIVATICERVRRIADEEGPVDETTDLTMDLDLDSASIMEMVFDLEEHFDIAIPLNELGAVRTVRQLAELVARLSSSAGS